MMNNLFLMFDPSTSNSMSLNWLILITPFMLMTKSFWWKSIKLSMLYNNMNKNVFSDMKSNSAVNNYNSMMIMMTLFFMIYSLNTISIFPYIFTANSHLSITLFLSTPLWITIFSKNWYTNPNNMLAHQVPNNTPLFLSPFMVIIETISTLIRPLTLAIRLTANMVAGHILINLSSNLLNNWLTLLIGMMSLQILFLLELSVAIIQGYVFILLMTIYVNEM